MTRRITLLTRLALAAVCLGLAVVPVTAQKVPAPEDVLGFKVGADFKLATYEQATAYLKALEQASPLIRVRLMSSNRFSITGTLFCCAF